MKTHFILTSFWLIASFPLVGQNSGAWKPTADQIMAIMFERDTQREILQGGYSGRREYIFDNLKLSKHAEMLVNVTGDPDGAKHFEVVSENGWHPAHKHVLHKMLESESDSSQPVTRPKTRLVSDNYIFQMVAEGSLNGRPTYVIDVIPKRHDKYSFQGRIWVDAEDYALARVEGEPAKNPSFFIHSVHFVQEYHKSGPFWYPASISSVTEARIFGVTEVTIRYFDYTPTSERARMLVPLTIKAAYVKP
jgi:hypothetical protein